MSSAQEKRVRYATAWRRIQAARKRGFYLEVVTLCESIMSDRLLSYVLRVNPASKANIHAPFARLIEEWGKLSGRGQSGTDTLPDLVAKVDCWRKQRNEMVHGLVKSTATRTVKQFMAQAKETADEGMSLARAIDNWQRREKRRLNRIARD